MNSCLSANNSNVTSSKTPPLITHQKALSLLLGDISPSTKYKKPYLKLLTTHPPPQRIQQRFEDMGTH